MLNRYDRGFRLGFIGSKDIPGTEAGKTYVNNHLRFIVKYHKSATFPGARIVGFEVEAYSVQHAYNGVWNPREPKLTSVPLRPDLPPMPAWSPEVIFTYDVVWEHSDIAWASRWDLYLYMGDDQVHWFSLLNSLVIVFLLSGIGARQTKDRRGARRRALRALLPCSPCADRCSLHAAWCCRALPQWR